MGQIIVMNDDVMIIYDVDDDDDDDDDDDGDNDEAVADTSTLA